MQRTLKSGQAPAIRLNYEDYARLPNDGRRYEIIEGDIHRAPAEVILSGHDIVQPDIVFVRMNPAAMTGLGIPLARFWPPAELV